MTGRADLLVKGPMRNKRFGDSETFDGRLARRRIGSREITGTVVATHTQMTATAGRSMIASPEAMYRVEDREKRNKKCATANEKC